MTKPRVLIADSMSSQALATFEDRGVDAPIAEPARDFTSGVPDPIPIRLIIGEDVRSTTRCAV